MDRPSPTAGQTWLVVAAVFLFCAIFVPGAVVVRFLALAGIIIGGTSLLIDLRWQSQVIIFALLGVALVVLWVRSDPTQGHGKDNADPPFNDRGPGALVGRVFQLEKPIEGGQGMLTYDGTAWRVSGKDCAAGQRVKVIRAEGTLLIVDPLECL
jgi:membrane protein implicated in regulation of membrane protease activity